MKTIRIIPRLDIKGPNVVKGIHLEGLRVMGKPETFARYYYESGADELIFQDVVASLYGRNSLHEIIEKTAKEIFIPLTVAGGIRTLSDINGALRSGADKVALNTAALGNKKLIREASRMFGSSTIVVAIEAVRQDGGRYLAFTDNGREHTGTDAIEWAQEAAELGAGEIVLTSVDREGTGDGYDLELIRRVADKVTIPIIAHGGAGRPIDVVEAVNEGHADAVSLASLLHYGYLNSNLSESASAAEGNVEFLLQRRNFHKFRPTTIRELKSHLQEAGICCRA